MSGFTIINLTYHVIIIAHKRMEKGLFLKAIKKKVKTTESEIINDRNLLLLIATTCIIMYHCIESFIVYAEVA